MFAILEDAAASNHDPPRHRDCELQHPGTSARLPAIAARGAAGPAPHHRRRRQRIVDGSAGAVRAAWPAVQVIEMGRNAGFAAATTPASGPARAIWCCCSTAIRSSTRAISIVWRPLSSAMRERAPQGRALSAPTARWSCRSGACCRPGTRRGRSSSPSASPRVSAPSHAGFNGASRRRTIPTGSAAPACWCVAPPARRPAGSTRGSFSTARMSTSARRCAPPGTVSSSLPEAEITHLRGQSGTHDRAAARAAYRGSQIAFYVKHHPRWAPILRLYLRARGAVPLLLSI